MQRTASALVFVIAAAWPTGVAGQAGAASPALPIPMTGSEPILDGRMSDGEWDAALVVADFLQRSPVEGAAPGLPTQVYLMHTRDALLIGMRAHQPGESVVATASRVDDFEQLVKNDQFAVAIDSYNDGRSGYWFSTNALGTRVDARFQEEGNIWDADWDGAWHCAASSDPGGWSVEISIPFRILQFERRDRVIMGINLYRRIIEGSEQIFAPLVPLSYPFGTPNVSVARKYVMEGIGYGSTMTLTPYLLAGVDRSGAVSSGTRVLSIGGELGYRPVPNVAFEGTWNTDFAETEADERQLNLSRFSLFFPEKRDFFQENNGLFQFGQPEDFLLYHSRRIGLAASGDGGYVTVPVRLGITASGRSGSAETGVLAVETTPSAGLPSERFLVGRMKLGVARRSYIGLLYTGRGPSGSSSLHTAGADASLYVLGNNRLYSYVAASGDDLGTRSGDDDTAWTLGLDRRSEEVNFVLETGRIGKQFDPVAGFTPYAGAEHTKVSLGVPWYFNTQQIRRFVLSADGLLIANTGGGLISSQRAVRLLVETPSEDMVGIFHEDAEEVLAAAFPIYRDTDIPSGDYLNRLTGLTLVTKPGRPVSGSLVIGTGAFYGGKRHRIETGVEWKAGGTLVVAAFLLRESVSTPFGDFDARLLRARAGFGLGAGLHAATLFQYDAQYRRLNGNTRITYTSEDGTQIHLVWTHAGTWPAGDPVSAQAPASADLLRLKIRFLLQRVPRPAPLETP